jgi:hypothetical protein
MGKNAKRKPRPALPRWVYLDRDGCWFCKNDKQCNSCKANKQDLAAIKKRKDKQEKKQLQKNIF